MNLWTRSWRKVTALVTLIGLGLTLGVNSSAMPSTSSDRRAIDSRVSEVRAAMRQTVSVEVPDTLLAQWGNWPNWANWAKWNDWNNWPNWGNWFNGR